jgi:hypothetical protein
MIFGRTKSSALDSAIIAKKATIKIICPQIGRSKSFALDSAIIAPKATTKIICPQISEIFWTCCTSATAVYSGSGGVSRRAAL